MNIVSESYTSGNTTKLILVTNGLSSITDTNSIKGEYRVVAVMLLLMEWFDNY